MHGSRIPIWFFIGVLLLIYGVLICGYGVYEVMTGNHPPLGQMTDLHTPVWWGGMLALLGVFYVVRFRPGKGSE